MIAIGSDHAGYELKEKIKEYLNDNDINYIDFGTNSIDSCDYPDFAERVSMYVSKNENSQGILVCGSGIGVSIVANKTKNVRAALCYSSECAELSRKHNNANVLCLGARFIDFEIAKEIIESFLNTDFEGGRHLNRVNKIKAIESVNFKEEF